MSFQFLTTEEVLYIHQAETEISGHNSNLRDLNLVASAVENTRQPYANGYAVNEASEVELADKVLNFIEKKFTEKEFSNYLRINAQKTI